MGRLKTGFDGRFFLYRLIEGDGLNLKRRFGPSNVPNTLSILLQLPYIYSILPVFRLKQGTTMRRNIRCREWSIRWALLSSVQFTYLNTKISLPATPASRLLLCPPEYVTSNNGDVPLFLKGSLMRSIDETGGFRVHTWNFLLLPGWYRRPTGSQGSCKFINIFTTYRTFSLSVPWWNPSVSEKRSPHLKPGVVALPSWTVHLGSPVLTFYAWKAL